MPWLQKRGGVWWIGYRLNGEEFRESLETTNEEEARQKLDRMNMLHAAKAESHVLERVYSALSGKQYKPATLREEVDSWVAEHKVAASEATADRYEGILENFCQHFKATKDAPLLRDISVHDLRKYFTERLKSVSPATANIERKILRMFFKRAIESGTIKENPIVTVKRFKQAAGTKREAFTVAQLSDIYRNANRDWQFMTMGGFYTGLRLGDLATMEWRKVEWKTRTFHTRDAKTDKSLHIPIAPALLAWLEKEWNRLGKPTSGHIVPKLASIYQKNGAGKLSNRFYTLMRDAGIPLPRRDKKSKGREDGQRMKRQTNPYSFHCLRHSFISFLKNTGASQAVAKELAGHSSDALSDLYTHTSTEVLTEAVSKLPQFVE